MHQFFMVTAIVLFALMLVVLYRVVFAQTIMTRIVAANMIGTKTTVLLLFIGIIYHRLDMFVDLALTYALLNFVGTLAVAKYFYRNKRTQIELDPQVNQTTGAVLGEETR